jgi:hypothetical protein
MGTDLGESWRFYERTRILQTRFVERTGVVDVHKVENGVEIYNMPLFNIHRVSDLLAFKMS